MMSNTSGVQERKEGFCSECGHSLEDHAWSSRIVGCQSRGDAICGCRRTLKDVLATQREVGQLEGAITMREAIATYYGEMDDQAVRAVHDIEVDIRMFFDPEKVLTIRGDGNDE